MPQFTMPAVTFRSAVNKPTKLSSVATARDTVASRRVCENCAADALQRFSVPDRAQLWFCPECSLYQGGTLSSQAVYENTYHDGYFRALPRKTLTAHARLARLRPLLDQDAPRRPPRVLDIGCSVGATLAAAKELGWNAQGVDVSQSAVDGCRQRGLQAKVYDGGRLPYDDCTFDLITSWHVIEHVGNVQTTLDEWYRVLRPGGLMILETPHAMCWKARLLGAQYAKFWPAEHLYTFTPKNLAPFLTRAGLEPLPLPLVVWPQGLSPQKTAYALAHQTYLAATKLTGFCKSFQILARRPWSSIEAKSKQSAA